LTLSTATRIVVAPMVDKIAVGIALTNEPEATRSLLHRFCHELAVATGLPVVAHGMWQYHHLVGALQADQVQLAWLPPLLALRAAALELVLPMVLPVRSGVSSYSTALFTREGGPSSLDELDGARVAWVDPHSAGGYLIIRASLRARGYDLDKLFDEEHFLGQHDAVARAVHEGHADVGASFVYLDRESGDPPKVVRAGWGDLPMRPLATAGPIPSDMLAANVSLDADIAATLRDALVTGESKELASAARRLLGAEGFVAPSAEHIGALDEVLAGLDAEAKPANYSVLPPRD
jgi:phosphonate transport system substrate-binding protein